VLTTSLPRNFKHLAERIKEWCHIKNEMYRGQAGLQLSINSTSEKQRNKMFSGKQLPLKDIANIGAELPNPIGRKYCLNFAYSTDFEIDAKKLASLFNPNKFMVKITPIHNNNSCRKNGIQTVGGYETYIPYESVEKDLIAVGFDVLVFVPSMDEENGLVTCGNAILGGGQLKV
jgi:23S rRNA (adenine2503-C2)-methyltransferase